MIPECRLLKVWKTYKPEFSLFFLKKPIQPEIIILKSLKDIQN